MSSENVESRGFNEVDEAAKEINESISKESLGSPVFQAFCDLVDANDLEARYENAGLDNPDKSRYQMQLALVKNDIRNNVNKVPGYRAANLAFQGKILDMETKLVEGFHKSNKSGVNLMKNTKLVEIKEAITAKS